MPGNWHKDDPSSRFASTMSAGAPNFPAQYPQTSHQQAHRYQFAPYFVPNPHQTIDTLNACANQASFAPRQSWVFDVHNLDLEYPDTPSDVAYCERGAASTNYYANSTPSQLVGYPESSQRTLLHEAAYAGGYALPYHEVPVPYRNEMPSSADAGQYAIDPTGGVRHRSRGGEGDVERRGAYGSNGQYLDGRADFEHAASAHRLLSQSTSGLLSHAGGSSTSTPIHPMLHVFPAGSPTSPLPPIISDSSTLTDAQSPRLASYALQTRRNSSESVHDPTSPSAVPPLVYDGEIGEDCDDDSESSPPSAASELARTPYPAGTGMERPSRETHVHDNWSQSSLDSAYSGTSSAQEFENFLQQRTRSPNPPSEGDSSTTASPSESKSSERIRPIQKKSKMHQCTVCSKLFPRPSGLATHMNSHSGAKPYKCPIPTCTKSFAVRSNAKRHLRTHGIFPSSDHASPSPSQFTVGFDTPMVSEVHEVGKLPSKLRWVPQSLATRTNVDYLRDAQSDSDDEYLQSSCPLLSVPLPPVRPSTPTWNPDDRYEERDSYGEADASPYISSQWRGLPGPAIISSANF
ncbi:hypothetical protein AcV5_003480 [Taiwanofungus camphoratus]|nr:hypothetical protein AcV5_003480 [Antrodia cinnamomea]KAI0934995.1 hypothetical protein AcV7_003913 [Antrodia cinnamomea]